MRSSRLPRSLAVALALVALATGLILGNSAAPARAQTPPTTPPRGLTPPATPASAGGTTVDPALLAKAQRDGAVPVIVSLRLASGFRPEGALTTTTEINAQRSAIVAAQDRTLARLPGGPTSSVKRFTSISGFAISVDADGLAALAAAPDVLAIGEDVTYGPNLEVSVSMIGGDRVADTGFTGSGQTIAILDTGVLATHPMFNGKVVSEACYSTNASSAGATSVCPGNATSTTAAGSGAPCTFTGCDHGTHVAGIAAGKDDGTLGFSGVARDANIISINVFSRLMTSCAPAAPPCARAFTSDIVAGLQRVLTLSGSYNIAAVNMSLGQGKFTTTCDGSAQTNPENIALKQAIDSLIAAGIPTIVAAGNNAHTDAVASPACISTVIRVGSVTTADVISSFSNSSPLITMLAPGSNIRSAVTGEPNIGIKSGTSMAAPHVAGAWALLKQKRPQAAIAQIQTALTSTGVPVTDARNNVTKPRIQIDAAADALGPPFAPPTNDLIENATPVTTTPVVFTQSVWSFTTSAADPTFAAPCPVQQGLRSAWFRYPAGQDGWVTVDSSDAYYDTIVAIYREDGGVLTPVQCADIPPAGPNSQAILRDAPVLGGSTYLIEVVQKSGTTPSSGQLGLAFSFRPDVGGGDCTISWTNPVNGNWSDAARWTPNRVPNASDSVCIDAATALGYTVRLDQSATVQRLRIGPDTGTGNQALAIGAASADITLTVTDTLINNGGLDLDSNGGGASNTRLVAKYLDNNGQIKTLPPASGTAGTRSLEVNYLDNEGTVLISHNTVFTDPGNLVPPFSLGHGVLNSGTIEATAGVFVRSTPGPVYRFTNLATLRVINSTFAVESTARLETPKVRSSSGQITIQTSASDAKLSVAGDLTNNALLVLTSTGSVPGIAELELTNGGTLINNGAVQSRSGPNNGSSRRFTANIENHGSFDIFRNTTLAKPGGHYENFGTMVLSGFKLTIAEGVYTLRGGGSIGDQGGAIVDGTVEIGVNGALNGFGVIGANVTNHGKIGPGLDVYVPDELQIKGTYTQSATGTYIAEIGGTTAVTGYDRLTILGDMTLDGTVDIRLINAFVPTTANSFTPIIGRNRTGDFATFSGLTQPSGLTFGKTWVPVGINTTLRLQRQTGPVTIDAALTAADGGCTSKTLFKPGDPIAYCWRVNNTSQMSLPNIPFTLTVSSSGTTVSTTTESRTVPAGVSTLVLTSTLGQDIATAAYEFKVELPGAISRRSSFVVQAAQAFGQIVAVPLEAGFTSSQAAAINSFGHVAGTVTGAQTAAIILNENGIFPVGQHQGRTTVATGINDNATVVGHSSSSAGAADHAFAWYFTFTDISDDPSRAHGVNNARQVAGEYQPGAAGGFHAYRWKDGVLTDVHTGMGGPGALSSTAYAINSAGVLAGQATSQTTPSLIRTPVIYNPDTNTRTALAALPGATRTLGEAFAINDQGHAAGYTDQAGKDRAVLWRNGTVVDLGVLPGFTASRARGLNSLGQVVGEATGATNPHAFLWQNGVLTDLNSLLPANSGWVLHEARGINNLGQITGIGTLNGVTRGFVFTPPQVAITSGMTRLESFTLPADGSPVSSFAPLTPGQPYFLRVSGVLPTGGPGFADAEYAFGGDGANPRDRCDGTSTGVDVGIQLDGGEIVTTGRKLPYWGAYNPQHTYVFPYYSTGSPLTLRFQGCPNAGPPAPAGPSHATAIQADALIVELFEPSQSGATFGGTVLLQGRTGTTPAGIGHAAAMLALASGQTVNVNATGGFVLAALADGTHLLTASAPGYLPATIAVTVANGVITSSLPPITLPAGRVTPNDDTIDIRDVTAIIAAFGSRPPAGKDAQGNAVDVNGDGVVNILDLTLTLGNFGKAGPVPWQPDPGVGG